MKKIESCETLREKINRFSLSCSVGKKKGAKQSKDFVIIRNTQFNNLQNYQIR